MTLENLIELERKATPTPWDDDTYNTVVAGSESTHDLVEICTIPDEPETGDSRKRTREEWYPESAINRQLIPALRNAAPGLLDVAAKAQAVIYGCHKCSGYLDGRLPQCPEHNALRAALAKLEGKGL